MKVVNSARRQIVMATLLGLAVVGAAMRHWAPNPSLTRDIGTLLLVLWLPAVGNLVGFVIQKIPRRPGVPSGFASTAPFTGHLLAELTPMREDAGRGSLMPPNERQCILVKGGEGFSARVRPSLQEVLAPEASRTVEFELLKPRLALIALPDGADFQVLWGRTLVATGHVTSHLATAPTQP